ncbi:MAG: 30S ribosomal protein S17 [Candidatus Cloacimonetes bacterium]|nr:30S ribosomal protein S17 [Candidatus Cloacimonadota bacterium]MBT6993558.1 30S ribosomal protein S17 [Candidatus Cloacimonadota bacterium]MBT7470296.1 30S ribosomal protein S17 [Candidatus Cloacimonadota bacterium]
MTGRKITKIGTVVSDKMDKTIVVSVQRQYKHPLYKKIVRKHKKFKAHDENNDCKMGDVVEIIESKPLSKEKRWALNNIIERSK